MQEMGIFENVVFRLWMFKKCIIQLKYIKKYCKKFQKFFILNFFQKIFIFMMDSAETLCRKACCMTNVNAGTESVPQRMTRQQSGCIR